MFKFVAFAIGAVTILTLLSGCGGNPMGPFAGGALSAPVDTQPFTAYDDIATVDTVFLETKPDDPYSVQTWIIAVDQRLYVPTSLIMGDEAAERQWVQNLLANPALRVQIGAKVYPMVATRVMEKDRHKAVLQAFQDKYASELPEIDDHAANAWIFELNRRPTTEAD